MGLDVGAHQGCDGRVRDRRDLEERQVGAVFGAIDGRAVHDALHGDLLPARGEKVFATGHHVEDRRLERVAEHAVRGCQHPLGRDEGSAAELEVELRVDDRDDRGCRAGRSIRAADDRGRRIRRDGADQGDDERDQGGADGRRFAGEPWIHVARQVARPGTIVTI